MVPTYAYGHDFGNAETCGVISYAGQMRSRCIPSLIAQGTLTELKSLDIRLTNLDHVYKDTSTELYVGHLALSQASQSFSGRGDINRYWSKKSLYLLLVNAASLIDDPEFALNVVTGLPIQTYTRDPESRKRVKEALEGAHTFTLNGEQRTIHIHIERVIMEGAGAMLIYGLKDQHVRQGVIDIGGRTTDLYVTQGQTPIRHRCTGEALGVENVSDAMSEAFQGKYGRALEAGDRRAILRAYASHGVLRYPDLYVNLAKVPDLKEMAHNAITTTGGLITSFVSTHWNESETGQQIASSFAKVLLIGGGAYYFQEHIRQVIPHIQVVERSEEANALGYAMFAQKQTQQRNLHIA